jgi:hypothetical protein
MRRLAVSLVLVAPLLLGGCLDQFGIESASAVAARRDAEGKAIGGACRHAGRAIEDCYALNRKAEKAAVFAGWREMNDYMRENQIADVPPQASAAGGDDTPAKPDKPGKGDTPPDPAGERRKAS